MGYGDFKLFAAFGAWFGWQMLAADYFIASFTGAVVGIALIVIRGRDRNIPIPFGPLPRCGGLDRPLWGDQLVTGICAERLVRQLSDKTRSRPSRIVRHDPWLKSEDRIFSRQVRTSGNAKWCQARQGNTRKVSSSDRTGLFWHERIERMHGCMAADQI